MIDQKVFAIEDQSIISAARIVSERRTVRLALRLDQHIIVAVWRRQRRRDFFKPDKIRRSDFDIAIGKFFCLYRFRCRIRTLMDRQSQTTCIRIGKSQYICIDTVKNGSF